MMKSAPLPGAGAGAPEGVVVPEADAGPALSKRARAKVPEAGAVEPAALPKSQQALRGAVRSQCSQYSLFSQYDQSPYQDIWRHFF